jgi:hypothetical protein
LWLGSSFWVVVGYTGCELITCIFPLRLPLILYLYINISSGKLLLSANYMHFNPYFQRFRVHIFLLVSTSPKR